jgi:hypothetical protein
MGGRSLASVSKGSLLGGTLFITESLFPAPHLRHAQDSPIFVVLGPTLAFLKVSPQERERDVTSERWSNVNVSRVPPFLPYSLPLRACGVW